MSETHRSPIAQGACSRGLEPVRPGGRLGDARRAVAGFSLVELLLALALGLLVIGGLVRLFAGSKQAYALLHDQARLQESGRYALAFIGRSARAAGYLGCNALPGHLVNTLNGHLDALFELDLRRAVDAFDGSAGASPAAFAQAAGIDADEVIAGTDILTLRRLDSPLRRVAAPVGPDDSPVVETGAQFDLNADDFVLIGDCRQASLFRVTRVIMGAGQATLLRDTGTGAYENAAGKTLIAAGQAYGPIGAAGPATVGRVLTETYFIAAGSSIGALGQRSLSLWRRTGTGSAAELVEGIADLQVLFGVDTQPQDGVDGINRLVRRHELQPGSVIRAIRVLVTAGEAQQRRVFSQTFRLRNLA